MKFCVIGVGRFGYHVAITLADNGMDVLAVDGNESTIASIKDKVTQAICMRITNEEELRSVGVEDMDTVIVAMGENFAQSILVTALLKQNLKIRRVIARSISAIHRDILLLIGADQVILPEQEMGIRLADMLSLNFDIIARISPDFSISKITAPKKFIGKTVESLNMSEQYHASCIGKIVGGEIIHVDPQFIITEGDVLVMSGSNNDLARLAKLA